MQLKPHVFSIMALLKRALEAHAAHLSTSKAETGSLLNHLRAGALLACSATASACRSCHSCGNLWHNLHQSVIIAKVCKQPTKHEHIHASRDACCAACHACFSSDIISIPCSTVCPTDAISTGLHRSCPSCQAVWVAICTVHGREPGISFC